MHIIMPTHFVAKLKLNLSHHPASGSVLSRHLLEGSFPPNIETSPQEFSATPAVKLKIMSILD